MWLLPTLNRIKKLEHCLKTAKNQDTTTPGMILIDKNDWITNEAAYLELKELFPNDDWGYVVTEAVTMGDKCREVWEQVKDSAWVGILNDDFSFQSYMWDSVLISKLDGKNFVSSNDRWLAPMRATTATVWSMPLLNAVGWPIFPPQLTHLHIDTIWETLGRRTGCWHIAMNVIVEHRHVLKGYDDDATNKVTYNSYFEAQKKGIKPQEDQIYEKFVQENLEKLVEKIRAFQDYLPGEQYNPDRKTIICESQALSPS